MKSSFDSKSPGLLENVRLFFIDSSFNAKLYDLYILSIKEYILNVLWPTINLLFCYNFISELQLGYFYILPLNAGIISSKSPILAKFI